MSTNIDFKNSVLIEDGEIKDLAIRFTGNLNSLIDEYFKRPENSQICKFIHKTFINALVGPIEIEGLEST